MANKVVIPARPESVKQNHNYDKAADRKPATGETKQYNGHIGK